MLQLSRNKQMILLSCGGGLISVYTYLQIVRREDNLYGKERLSMSQIIDRLILRNFQEFDTQLRGLLQQRMLRMAVELKASDNPCMF